MARYGPEHKERTRRRILDAAGERLKRDGIDGSGVATVMSDAGLTNGAFYKHFDSKSNLVAAAIADQLRAQRDALRMSVTDRQQLLDLIPTYLSPEHRSGNEDGCPSAALLDELARCDEETRSAYTAGLLAMMDDLASHIEPKDSVTARVRVLTAFAAMIGTLQMARAITDQALSDELMAHAVDRLISDLSA